MMHKSHPFHLVEISPWPIVSSLGTLITATGLTKWFHLFNTNLLMISLMINLLVMFQWWRDVVRESSLQGLHTFKVTHGMRWGMMLFISSEVMFFLSFFWSIFHSGLSPTIELGMLWPPKNIIPFNPIQIPLLNTLILISSGITVTWAHHSLMENNYNQAMMSLSLTVILGIYFSMLQAYEYMEAPFSIADAVYGSSFFLATGFHGLHVIIGTIFLTICLIRLWKNQFSMIHHFGFEASAWYWHFVDVVWLFLYLSVYWWGS
uniref:Cytochrome c oxidase subunit 3 n=1 Tax=Melasis buprestoides TaxID=195231 RepID=A0A343C380_9COLE|nr:cytochrome c oxidase subunit 3 [Melasis buprestoides]